MPSEKGEFSFRYTLELFSKPPVVKIEKKIQCLSGRKLPAVFKTHLTLISRAIFDGVMAISNIDIFLLGHPEQEKLCTHHKGVFCHFKTASLSVQVSNLR